ncbi:MAG: xylulokinase [Thermomicrobiales bacterium]|nr:xylulokinase [Thermomicrobiales bacterium]
MSECVLGIDLGTSAVKALLVDERGHVRGVGSAEYPVRHPKPGYAEQDPDEWWAATGRAVRQATGWSPAEIDIVGIGLTGQMHGTVLLGESEQVLAPAIIWADGRAWRQARELTERIGPGRLIEIAGSPVATGFQAATILWLEQERGSLWWRARKVLTPTDELRRRLTGEIVTDPGDGSGTLLLDVRWRTWSPDLMRAVGVDQQRLPKVQPAASVAGELTERAAETLGLRAGIPVATGTADAPAGLLGAGIVEPTTMLLSISTGAQAMIPATMVRPDPGGRTHTFCAALEPSAHHPGWYQMGATLAAGMAMRWLRDEMLHLVGPDAYDRMTGWAAESPVGASGLLFLPYLAGERSPHMDARLRGALLGLAAHHERGDVVRAVMEGVVLACYDAFAVLREQGAAPRQIVMAGGGARSPLWRQIVADIFGLPVFALATADQAAMGAAALAFAGSRGMDPASLAHDWAAYGPPLSPDRARHQRYGELFALFREAHDATAALSHKLVEFAEPPRESVQATRPRRT